jgi:proteic killer suppression protein
MIRSFKDKLTEAVFDGRQPKRFPSELFHRARHKLLILDAATSLDDLKVPPGNKLEALSGNRKGQHSIRINDQWRICFAWRDGGAEHAEIADYY